MQEVTLKVPTFNDVVNNVKKTVTSKEFVKTALKVAAVATLTFSSVAIGSFALASYKATTTLASYWWVHYYPTELISSYLATGILASLSTIFATGAIREAQQIVSK